MTQPEIRISLDIHEVESQTTLELSHFDSSKILKISLTDKGLPYTISEECRAILIASKADGTYIINECEIADSLITYPLTAQTTSATGNVSCEIRLTGGNDDILLTSPRFSIFVVPTVYENGGAASASKNEFDALSKLITDSRAMISEIEASLERGDFVGEKGDKGDKGDTGDDGVSPYIEITPIDNGNKVSITDANGTKSFDVHHGNGVNEYELTYYTDTPTESQQLAEKSTVTTILNETANYIVYVNYNNGKHPASICKKDGNIYFCFISPNEEKRFEISYISASDSLQYEQFDLSVGESITDMEQTVTSDEDGGSNTFTFTLGNGTTADFNVKNGSKGDDGKDGADGLSAYEIAQNHGFEGTEAEWLESLKGEDGKDGADGVGGTGSGECNLPEVAPKPETELISSPDTNFTYDSFYDWHMYSVATVLNLAVGDKCKIVWDTSEYFCTVVDVSSVLTGYKAIGNLAEFGFGGNDEPFIIAINDAGTAFAAIKDTAPDTHSFAVYKVGSSPDEEKFLQVVDGKATWVTIALAEDGGF